MQYRISITLSHNLITTLTTQVQHSIMQYYIGLQLVSRSPERDTHLRDIASRITAVLDYFVMRLFFFFFEVF